MVEVDSFELVVCRLYDTSVVSQIFLTEAVSLCGRSGVSKSLIQQDTVDEDVISMFVFKVVDRSVRFLVVSASIKTTAAV